MPQQLPAHPNLDHLKKQAKNVLRVFKRQRPRWKLADAQRAIARGYGFINWPSLKTHVEKVRCERARKADDSCDPKTSLGCGGSTGETSAIHPIAGVWAHSDPQSPHEETTVVEFQVSGEEIHLTQVAADTTGHEIAITTTIRADGHEHPVPFGEGVRLKALWATPLRLEAMFTMSEQKMSAWSYEVTPDGKSLFISTANDRIVFKRV
jgi:hypothetical protein